MESADTKLLCVDIGNSRTHIGLMEGRTQVAGWRVSTDVRRTHDEWWVLVRNLWRGAGFTVEDLKGIAVCSTVPAVQHEWRAFAQTHLAELESVIIEPGVRTGLPMLTDNPREVGADRVMNAVGAVELYDGPTIVVDFGTATTIDVIDAKGQYLGGAIAAGLELSMRALGSSGAQLRSVELRRPRSVIARNTVESMQAGLVYGYASQVDGIVHRMIAELGAETSAVNVVATGEHHDAVVTECESVTTTHDFLTHVGLSVVFGRTQRK